MQTFLPFPDFAATARVLDHRRLGKQRVETLQIQRALVVPGHGWRHHPAVRMWAGHEEALVRYGVEICAEWRSQGFRDTCEATMRSDLAQARGIVVVRTQDELAAADELPVWLGDPEVHLSHRSALVRKDPAHYRRFFPGVPDDLPYVWPPTLTRTVNPSASRPMDT
ncbi:MSMEG_6728 family protein [Lentzea sp. BCCO 10_0798]|uniref:MSMEG_6728 family protein n=1 Tax=Lentzea kristufekii TaxID=3095430 RepID=A0ABU4TS66_9PSEU|nr:MSMEG_6728 family protein [Lentzea sp. BCCO 10_0798]MDX8051045.1 MSMEG_6728 family protein [Lentzea sp. BCCO 10_0798]